MPCTSLLKRAGLQSAAALAFLYAVKQAGQENTAIVSCASLLAPRASGFGRVTDLAASLAILSPSSRDFDGL